ncbi:hypothetical protein LXA43DRAFT_1094020 [Ganoderma leucocontextum]|nr:hypothetical protein LXA43DRAFT_1094020 [Ganoderma leucocontextum]
MAVLYSAPGDCDLAGRPRVATSPSALTLTSGIFVPQFPSPDTLWRARAGHPRPHPDATPSAPSSSALTPLCNNTNSAFMQAFPAEQWTTTVSTVRLLSNVLACAPNLQKPTRKRPLSCRRCASFVLRRGAEHCIMVARDDKVCPSALPQTTSVLDADRMPRRPRPHRPLRTGRDGPPRRSEDPVLAAADLNLRPQSSLNATQDLGDVSSSFASLPQNMIPATVDPSQPIDPQLILDFDPPILGRVGPPHRICIHSLLSRLRHLILCTHPASHAPQYTAARTMALCALSLGYE